MPRAVSTRFPVPIWMDSCSSRPGHDFEPHLQWPFPHHAGHFVSRFVIGEHGHMLCPVSSPVRVLKLATEGRRAYFTRNSSIYSIQREEGQV